MQRALHLHSAASLEQQHVALRRARFEHVGKVLVRVKVFGILGAFRR